jgi:hypothetical protein
MNRRNRLPTKARIVKGMRGRPHRINIRDLEYAKLPGRDNTIKRMIEDQREKKQEKPKRIDKMVFQTFLPKYFWEDMFTRGELVQIARGFGIDADITMSSAQLAKALIDGIGKGGTIVKFPVKFTIELP